MLAKMQNKNKTTQKTQTKTIQTNQKKTCLYKYNDARGGEFAMRPSTREEPLQETVETIVREPLPKAGPLHTLNVLT